MIFVTIGTQEPFDRLVAAMDAVVPQLGGEQVVAQVSNSKYKAQHMGTHNFLTPTEFNAFFSQARLIVSHAGMGNIISALVQKKPILIVPRIAKYGEHRNDHQMATAKAFESLEYVNVVYNTDELGDKLQELLKSDLVPKHQLGSFASQELLASIQNFIKS